MEYRIYLAESIKPNFYSMNANIKREFDRIGIKDEDSFLKHIETDCSYFFKQDDTFKAKFTNNVPGYKQKNVNKSLGTIINENNELVSYLILIPTEKLRSRTAYISQQLVPTLTNLMGDMINAPGNLLSNHPIIVLNANFDTFTDSNALAVASLNALPNLFYVDMFQRDPVDMLRKKGIEADYRDFNDSVNVFKAIKSRVSKFDYDDKKNRLTLLLGNLKKDQNMTNEPYYYIFDVLPIIYLAIDNGITIDCNVVLKWWNNYSTKFNNKNMLLFVNWLKKVIKNDNSTMQKVYFGAPGTGKSYLIDTHINHLNVPESQIFRTTFHAEYSYSDFIGQIMPGRKHNKQNGQYDIVYEFKEGVFVKALKRAYLDLSKNVYLIVEEISRGNVASIFGDVFQLLDRELTGSRKGYSKYGIRNINVSNCLPLLNSDVVRLPPNLQILGTVNTNDQNVFTIDTAFKRRFQWQYIGTEPVKDPLTATYINNPDILLYRNKKKNFEIVHWTDLYGVLNIFISDRRYLGLGEDKQIGPFFIEFRNLSKNDVDGEIRNKLFNYLWSDIAGAGNTYDQHNLFSKDITSYAKLYQSFGSNIKTQIFSDEFFDAYDLWIQKKL